MIIIHIGEVPANLNRLSVFGRFVGPQSMSYPHCDVHLVVHSRSFRVSFNFQFLALGICHVGRRIQKAAGQTVRELAQITTDPFIKQRLIKLVARYEDGDVAARILLTPGDLKCQSQGTGSER
jgi:hypothetical protein